MLQDLRPIALGLACLLFSAVDLLAQEKLTEHTLQLTEGATGPSAKVTDFAWLEGHWEAEALGGTGSSAMTDLVTRTEVSPVMSRAPRS